MNINKKLKNSLKYLSVILIIFYSSLLFSYPLEKIFASTKARSTKLSLKDLGKPYDFLLTQPLMTKPLEDYYKSAARIKVLFSENSKVDHSYSRVILMLMGENSLRAELALIKINFQALPKEIKNEILKTNIPFGKILLRHKLQVSSVNRSYFYINCDKILTKILGCKLNTRLYGRHSTLIKADKSSWVAEVTEILS